jgi:hypothetical protein
MSRIRMLVVLIGVLAVGLTATASAGLKVSTSGTAQNSARLGDPKDCSDFGSQRSAQRWFHNHDPHGDPAGLDADNDGWACDSNPPPKARHRW